MAENWTKYKTRKGHLNSNRLSRRLAKPNVVRIEVLDADARQAYMGGFQKTLDAFKNKMVEAIAESQHFNMYEPFYGILDMPAGVGPTINVAANWERAGSGRSGFARLSTLLTDDGNGGPLGVLSKGMASKVNGVLTGIDKIAQTGMAFAGVNNTMTGSTTIKAYKSGNIDCQLPLKFRWYLPEQENACRISLKRLITMAYVRPVNQDGSVILNEMINGLLASGSTLAGEFKQFAQKEMSTGFTGAVNEATGGGVELLGVMAGGAARTVGDVAGAVAGAGAGVVDDTINYSRNLYNDGSVSSNGPSYVNMAYDKVKSTIKSVVGAGINSYNNINSFFGGEITANPLPVRVSFGHYVDLEPMVIRNVKISSSAEQFISPDGTHLPVFVTADVTVEYWMQPGPDKEFMSFLGNEVFEEFIDRSTPVGKNKDDGKINSGTPKK